jgi:hypothetical protein
MGNANIGLSYWRQQGASVAIKDERFSRFQHDVARVSILCDPKSAIQCLDAPARGIVHADMLVPLQIDRASGWIQLHRC